MLILTDGAAAPRSAASPYVAKFDGNDEDAVKTARERWKFYKEKSPASYYQQDDAGCWQQNSKSGSFRPRYGRRYARLRAVFLLSSEPIFTAVQT